MVGYIHIGAPKCGSTALQQAILANIEYLEVAGIHAPKSQNFAEELAHRFTQGWRNSEEIRKAVSREEDDFIPNQGDILLSSEAFLACAASPLNLQDLIASFCQDELHVLGVIRDPASLLESTWFQWMRTYRAFEKVRKSMNHASLYFENYIDSGWFEKIDHNWRNWQSHELVKSFKEVRIGLDRFDATEIIADFINQPLPNKGKESTANVSMNGVTFRILKEYRNVPLRGYDDFVRKLERAMRSKGYGDFRFLSDSNARKINRSAASLPLFKGFAGFGQLRPAAQDIPKIQFAELLIEAREIARPFLVDG